ncbi:exocyst complex component Sec5-domain-containing protein [Pyronema omphalodes]|nr:exocyst complex component Sec5-domain-containing protein [Pyronema omphalodes]
MGESRSDPALLKHYRLQDPFPTSWSDPIEEAHKEHNKRNGAVHRKSTVRYSILQEEHVSASLKGLIGDEFEGGNVPKDESDPLGTTDSVVRVLRQRGLPVEDNVRLRSRYLVSSKHFSPAAFLRDVHASTPSPTLQQGLNYLSQSIAQKSGSLKELVETNFDRFVAAKATIENVYKEMKENAFMEGSKETEYGTGKIKAYLTEVSSKADEVFGPIMSGRGREEGLRTLLSLLNKHGRMLEMPGVILDCAKRKDYEALIDEYQKAQRWLNDSHKLVPDPKTALSRGIKEEHIHQVIIAEKMWMEIEFVIDDFKKDTWKRLIECKTEDASHMELIGILLELGVEDNPITFWLVSRYDYLKSRISAVFEKSRVEIEVHRRKILNAPAPTTQTIAHHLRSAARRALITESQKAYDVPLVNAFWELVYSNMMMILDANNGVLGELLSFWKVCQSFIDGDNLLPVGLDESSRKHHRLPDEEVRFFRDCALELVGMIRQCMVTFFNEPPVEDISSQYTPMPITPVSATIPEFPPPSPVPPTPKMRGQEGDEVYAFFPPGANSIGAMHYLGKVMILLGKAAANMAESFNGLGKGNLQDDLRSMLSVARDRTVKSVLSAWLTDAEHCKVMEDWTRALDNRGVTKMPGYFMAFEKDIILGMQSIVYLDKVRSGETTVIPPPSLKFLTNVRSQFVRTLYQALQGMVENAKTPTASEEADPSTPAALATPAASLTAHSVDSRDKNTRMLLTLSNLQLLRSEIVPELIHQFEICFSCTMSDEAKTIKDVLGQIDAQLFSEFTSPIVAALSKTVRAGILSSSWSPPPGKLATEVKPYVYDALLLLVDVHAQVTITAPSLVQQVLSYLLEKLSHELLESFRQRKSFNLGELLQATLDVEFVNQTLSQYNTPKSQEAQQMVYVELDRGSDVEARQGLQAELGQMKNVLSSLRRYSRAEFKCFRSKKPETGSRRSHD